MQTIIDQFETLVNDIEDFFAPSTWDVDAEAARRIADILWIKGVKSLDDAEVDELQAVVLEVIG